MSAATAAARAKYPSNSSQQGRSSTQTIDADYSAGIAQERADEIRAAQVRAVLANCQFASPKDYSIHVSDGVVQLTGRVHSFYRKQQATVAAQSVDGVEKIINDLKVSRREDGHK